MSARPFLARLAGNVQTCLPRSNSPQGAHASSSRVGPSNSSNWNSGPNGHPSFLKKDLFPQLVSETHAMHCVDIDGDGLKDLVTGKRKWSHGKSEPGSDRRPELYWFQAKKSSDGTITFTPQDLK